MMGMVDRDETEFALGPFAVTHEREVAIDFSMAVESDTQKIIMVRPGLENDIAGFLKPFTSQVWLLILTSMVCVGAALTFLVWGEAKIFGQFPKRIVSKAVMWVIQTLSQENSEWLPEGDGARVVVSTWLLASLVFMSSYSGILTAMLTIPKVTIPIDSLSDLVRQRKLPWRLEAGAMIQPYLQYSNDEIHQRAFYKMSGTTPDCWTSRQAVADGEYAVICDQTSIKKVISWDFSNTGKCHTYIGREPVYSNIMMSIAFRRNSSYLPQANRLISILRNTGIFAKWLRDEIGNTTQCLKPPTSDRQDGIEPLGIDAFYGLIFLLVGGWILGLLAFTCEYCIPHKLRTEENLILKGPRLQNLKKGSLHSSL
ncbi:glutamate receptor-like [Palaemon carinicauda]|uniref:glutamate receptor-like n=1 Tax=Palaemon carinicauda TaxID=392227 RepID=UPI0035B69FC6